MDYVLSKTELDRLLATEREVTIIKTLALLGIKTDRVSQNKAEKIVGGKAKLANAVKEGRITPIPNGNGKTSTVLYDYARLIEIRNSEKIYIHKAVVSD